MKAKATRTKTVTVQTEVEILSYRKSCDKIDPTNGSNMWLQLRRRCALCRDLFVAGDSVSLIMYRENGEQLSGGVHRDCLPAEDEIAPLNADEIARLQGNKS